MLNLQGTFLAHVGMDELQFNVSVAELGRYYRIVEIQDIVSPCTSSSHASIVSTVARVAYIRKVEQGQKPTI